MRNLKQLFFVSFLLFFIACKERKSSEKYQFTNELIKETSPYLLQHAHNPVNWKAWNKATLQQAKNENKLIVISVGYSSCHWCHVMEKESFQDTLIAKKMNENFINIKVDREERPDVDKVYMKAVQLMTGNGGWPLNVIALPDGRPFYGGTYFTKQQWQRILEQVSEKFKNSPENLYAFADKLEKGIKDLDVIEVNTEKAIFKKEFVEDKVLEMKTSFDTVFGGAKEEMKFMMPNKYQFLLRFAHQNNDKELLSYVEKTLQKIAFGGVFDHINGGFSRYSVDKKWHIPHFEKMLYDNAQLVSLYAKAYQLTQKEVYKEVVFNTLQFVKKELTSPEGMFYSSIDADSYNLEKKLEEGAYYTWQKDELVKILQDDFNLFSKYYNIEEKHVFEHNKYVLFKSFNDNAFSKQNSISLLDLKRQKKKWIEALKKVQLKREKPSIDNKSLTSWNALMLKGYLDAYTVFNNQEFLEIALKNANFVLENQLQESGKLYHSYKEGKSTINGYLEDYAFLADAFIQLYQVTSEEKWLYKSKLLIDYAVSNFYDENSKMFFFTSKKDDALVTKTIDYYDNVIASSNSVMAKNLFLLSHYFDETEYQEKASLMLNNLQPKIEENPQFYSNWLDLMLNYTSPFYEVVVTGKESRKKVAELNKNYLPNILIAFAESDKNLPLLESRFVEGETYIYVCVNNTCKLPVKTVAKTLTFLKN